MQYQRGSPQGQVYDLMHPPGRDVLSSKLNDYQGSHPRNLRNDRNVGQNQYITEQIANDPEHVQRHADMNLKMRNPLFHEFHYKKIIEPQYTMPQKKQEMEQVNTFFKNQDNVDSLDMFQQNYLQRQKNFDRAKQGHNLMNYQLDQQNRIPSNNIIQQQSPSNNYALRNEYPQAENAYQNIRQGSPPPPQQMQYNPQRASAPNIHKIPQNNQQYNQGPIAPPSRQYQTQVGAQNGIPSSRQVQSQQNLLAQQNQSQVYNSYQPDYQNDFNNQQQYDKVGSNNYQDNQYQQQQNRLKDFDNPQYQQQLKHQEMQLNQQLQQKGVPQQEYQLDQNSSLPQIYDQNPQNIQESRSPQGQQYNDQNNYQQQAQQYGYQPPLSASQIDNQLYSSPDILNDRRMKKIYNPLIQKVSAVYEPRYGVNASWDKYNREQFRNWENKDQHYFNIVKSKNYILDQHADYSTGNHEYGTKKVLY